MPKMPTINYFKSDFVETQKNTEPFLIPSLIPLHELFSKNSHLAQIVRHIILYNHAKMGKIVRTVSEETLKNFIV